MQGDGKKEAVEEIMSIPEHRFATLSQFLEAIDRYPNIAWIYRGESDLSRPIVSKAGRSNYFLPETSEPESSDLPPRDICRFNYWRKLAVAYDRNLPSNDFECLAYAQHYGLATRFLDWSTNPLVALFFAVDSCSKKEGAVYCYAPHLHLDPQKVRLGYLNKIAQFTPPPFDQRILLQSGVLTYMPNPSQPLTPESIWDLRELTPDHGLNLVRIVVMADMKPILKRRLDEIGINRKSLFPDLEGLSNFINWETERSATLSKRDRANV